MADAAVASPRMRSGSAGAWVLPPLLLLALLFFYPLLLIVREALGGDGQVPGLAHFGEVLGSRMFRSALWNTMVIAALSTVGCLVLGFVLSVLLAFTPFPGSRMVARLIDTFIALPTFLVALAFTFIYGSAGMINETFVHVLGVARPPVDFLYSQWGVILSEITVYTPFVMRPLLATFSQLDPAQIEVASSLGARALTIVRRIIFPAALPALIAGGSLCLLLTVNEFGIVLFIGAKDVITLPLLVYDLAIQQFDYASACIIAVVNIVLSLGLYTVYRFVLARYGRRRAGLV
ncbi:MAG: 2-aminoethylphosphonate ABC transporter permease subunit [Proteobacteria bacterium]|nr:2-aminoethylphosphonate ABC transporter permease subunit [Pseudomonadota bacterium]